MSIGSAGPNKIAVNTISTATYPALRAPDSILPGIPERILEAASLMETTLSQTSVCGRLADGSAAQSVATFHNPLS